MARGAEKYGPRNWELAQSVEEQQRFKASAFRHFMQWFHGVDDGEDHAAAVFFNITASERLRPIHDCVPIPRERLRCHGCGIMLENDFVGYLGDYPYHPDCWQEARLSK